MCGATSKPSDGQDGRTLVAAAELGACAPRGVQSLLAWPAVSV